jgi:CubicO group peptidase (beta-lactamase class C family)
MTQLKSAHLDSRFENAAKILEESIGSGQIKAATIVARQGTERFERAFGSANIDSAFLLGSITKPMALAAVMHLFEQGMFALGDAAHKYLPELKGDDRELITVQHLMTHVSGLPDQLPENSRLRREHSSLEQFAAAAMRTPLGFKPGARYQYSSMAILLACEIAQRLSGRSILELVQNHVVEPLGMQHSALGYGRLKPEQTIRMQTEHAAPEAGGGDASAVNWDWNSVYWRSLGAPWGGMHASAGDVLKFLDAFIHPPAGFLSQKTAELMTQNHNANVRVPRGLGFALGPITLSPMCSASAFGHTGSTGTIAWIDRERDLSLVVLTSLPAEAVKPHPRDLVATAVLRK